MSRSKNLIPKSSCWLMVRSWFLDEHWKTPFFCPVPELWVPGNRNWSNLRSQNSWDPLHQADSSWSPLSLKLKIQIFFFLPIGKSLSFQISGVDSGFTGYLGSNIKHVHYGNKLVGFKYQTWTLWKQARWVQISNMYIMVTCYQAFTL